MYRTNYTPKAFIFAIPIEELLFGLLTSFFQ